MRNIITWIEAKIYRQVLLMVAISVGFIIIAWAGETFGVAGNLAGAAGHATAILWKMFGIYLFVKFILRKPDTQCGCGNRVPNDWNFCTVCGAKRGVLKG